MAANTTAGSTFSITASVPASLDAAGYDALTYVTVGEVTDLGEVGREYNMVNHSPISNRLVQKIKGSYNAGSIQLQYARDYSDAGQNLLRTASQSDANYTFRIVTQTGKKLYFTGLVASFKTSLGNVDQISAGSTMVELQTDVVEV